MKKTSLKYSFRVLLLLLPLAAILLLTFASSAQKSGGTNPGATLAQASNGGIGQTPINPVGWENGNQNGQKSHYNEGESIPYRLLVTNLQPNTQYSVTLGYDITHSSKHAIDYITHPQRISELVNPCGGTGEPTISPCTPGTPGAIPAPSPGASPPDTATTVALKQIANTSFNALKTLENNTTSPPFLPHDQQIQIYNANISSVAYVTQGDPALSQSETTFKVTFTTTFAAPGPGQATPPVVLNWGGHIARAFDWDDGNSANGLESASGISGSPFHMRLKELCVPASGGGFTCSGGNQDRALASSAVQPPSGCTVAGNSTACSGTTNHHTLIGSAEAGVTYSWSISTGTGNTSTIASQNTDPNANTTYGMGVIYADVNVTGTGGSTYTITLTKANAAGTSTCPLMVTVTAPTVITSQPSSATRCPGSGVTFNVAATGENLTYQWKFASDGINFNNISGATSNSYSIASVSPTDAGSYKVEVTGTCGTVTSNVAVLTVNQNASTSDPADQTLCPGSTASFTTTASGTAPSGGFTFVWKKGSVTLNNGDLSGRVSIQTSGATSTLSISNISSFDAASYTVTADGECNDPSQTASLTLNQDAALTDPADLTRCPGGTASFTTTASGTAPSGGFAFTWKKGGTQLNNGDLGGRVSISTVGNQSTLSISGLVAGDAGAYSVEVDGECTDPSQSFNLTINENAALTDPADVTKCLTQTANFSTTASGTAPSGGFAFTWKKGTTTLTNGDLGGRVTITTVGAQSSLSISGLTAADAGAFSVTVDGECNDPVQNFNLTVNVPTVSISIVDACNVDGSIDTTLVATPGPGAATDYTYQWSGPSNNGATSQSIVPTVPGLYTVTITEKAASACGASASGTLCFQFTASPSASMERRVDASIAADRHVDPVWQRFLAELLLALV